MSKTVATFKQKNPQTPLKHEVKLVWDSERNGKFDAGRNAEKRKDNDTGYHRTSILRRLGERAKHARNQT